MIGQTKLELGNNSYRAVEAVILRCQKGAAEFQGQHTRLEMTLEILVRSKSTQWQDYKYKNHETSTTTYNNKRNITNKETNANNYMILTLISILYNIINITKYHTKTNNITNLNLHKFTNPPSSPSTLEAKPAKPSKLQSPWRRSKKPRDLEPKWSGNKP